MKYILPILALVGIAIAAVVVVRGNRPDSDQVPSVNAPAAPYEHYVSGAGLLEASSQNIAVGTPVAGIVSDIYVKWGDTVEKGAPLFRIDGRDAIARLKSAEADFAKAEAVLSKSRDDLIPLQGLTNVISPQEVIRQKDEVAINAADLQVAKAKKQEIETEIDRRTVRAPVAGRILRINVREGEYAPSGATPLPLMLVGDDSRLNVRVEVDERDASRVRPDSKAIAFVRGNPELRIPVQFVRIEPAIVSKSVLTGAGGERTETRVLQVLYGFERGKWPVYVGQEMDVFIEAPPLATEGT